MVEFSGWEMPLQYRSISDEHLAVRRGVGIFDVSHMGQLYIGGPESLDFLQHLLPLEVSRLSPGRMSYTAMCLESGGVLDDFPVYRLGETKFLLVVNAAQTESDTAWIGGRLAGWRGVELTDASLEKCMLAIQGPGSEQLTAALLGEEVGNP